jgi:hypothetical protein
VGDAVVAGGDVAKLLEFCEAALDAPLNFLLS